MFALEQMTLSRLSFVFEACEDGRLPSFLGSTLRGSFGHALKEVGCPGSCEEPKTCLEECAYSYCFETPIPPDAERMKRMQHAPHPFWFEVPEESKLEWRVGDRMHASMMLVGKAVDLFPYIVFALERMARIGFGKQRIRFRLVELCDGFGPEEAGPIWRGGRMSREPSVVCASELVQPDYQPMSVGLECVTPVRIFEKKKMLRQLPFRAFVRSLLSRFTSLQYFHCGTHVELDFRGILAEAEKVQTIDEQLHYRHMQRRSNRQDRKVPLDGLMGQVSWEGPALSLFWPLLQLGQLLHLGKGTVMGLGQYRIVEAK